MNDGYILCSDYYVHCKSIGRNRLSRTGHSMLEVSVQHKYILKFQLGSADFVGRDWLVRLCLSVLIDFLFNLLCCSYVTLCRSYFGYLGRKNPAQRFIQPWSVITGGLDCNRIIGDTLRWEGLSPTRSREIIGVRSTGFDMLLTYIQLCNLFARMCALYQFRMLLIP